VEQALDLQRDACVFHNSLDHALSLYADHQCSRDQIPTQSLQVDTWIHHLCTATLEFLRDYWDSFWRVIVKVGSLVFLLLVSMKGACSHCFCLFVPLFCELLWGLTATRYQISVWWHLSPSLSYLVLLYIYLSRTLLYSSIICVVFLVFPMCHIAIWTSSLFRLWWVWLGLF